MTGAAARTRRVPLTVTWGVVVGLVTVASPLVFWWLEPTPVYALGLVLIAAVAVTGSEWLVVAGLFGHGLKDLWQHRRRFAANMRWWPPFCAVVDGVDLK